MWSVFIYAVYGIFEPTKRDGMWLRRVRRLEKFFLKKTPFARDDGRTLFFFCKTSRLKGRERKSNVLWEI